MIGSSFEFLLYPYRSRDVFIAGTGHKIHLTRLSISNSSSNAAQLSCACEFNNNSMLQQRQLEQDGIQQVVHSVICITK